MFSLADIRQTAMLRVPLKEGSHKDFVQGDYPKEIPAERMDRARLFWGSNDLGQFPLTAPPDLKTLSYPVTVEIGRVNLDDQTLLGLSPGTVLPLDKPYPSTFDVIVCGLVVARGEVVVKEESFGLAVTEVFDPPQAPVSCNTPLSARQNAPTTVTVVLGRADLLGSDLTELAPPQIIPLDSKTGHPLVAELAGRPFALVEVLVAGDAFQFRIRELLAAGPVFEQEVAETARVETFVPVASRPMEAAQRREIEETSAEEEEKLTEPPPPPPSLENRSRALWCSRQIERRNPALAASLIATLATDDTVEVIRLLGETDAQTLVVPLSSWNLTPAEALTEYDQWSRRNPLQRQGIDDTKKLLEKVFAASRTVDMINAATAQLRGSPFSTLGRVSPSRLAAVVGTEHPQTIAVILAHLNLDLAAAVLDKLPALLLDEVVTRIAKLRPVNAYTLREVERVVEQLLLGGRAGDPEPPQAGGVAAALGLLDRGSSVTRQIVLELLDEKDPELAKKLRDE